MSLSMFIILFPFLGLVTLEVSEEFTSCVSSVEEKTTGSSETNVTNRADVAHNTCTTDEKHHQKLCKVSVGENVSPEKLTRAQNTEGVVLKDSKNSHRTQKDSLGSVMEKLVESAHFGKLGAV